MCSRLSEHSIGTGLATLFTRFRLRRVLIVPYCTFLWGFKFSLWVGTYCSRNFSSFCTFNLWCCCVRVRAPRHCFWLDLRSKFGSAGRTPSTIYYAHRPSDERTERGSVPLFVCSFFGTSLISVFFFEPFFISQDASLDASQGPRQPRPVVSLGTSLGTFTKQRMRGKMWGVLHKAAYAG